MTKYTELLKLAKAAITTLKDSHSNIEWVNHHFAKDRYKAAADPQTIIGLVEEISKQTAFIDAYLGQPDHTKVWDSIYLTEAKLANAVQLATKLQVRVDELEYGK